MLVEYGAACSFKLFKPINRLQIAFNQPIINPLSKELSTDLNRINHCNMLMLLYDGRQTSCPQWPFKAHCSVALHMATVALQHTERLMASGRLCTGPVSSCKHRRSAHTAKQVPTTQAAQDSPQSQAV